MGREVRRVPGDWEHPKDEQGHYKPIFDESFADAVAAWKRGYEAWERGERPVWFDGFDVPSDLQYWEHAWTPPSCRDAYRPAWADAERTHYQWYEDVTEGTPLSPPMPTLKALANWLAENGDGWVDDRRRTAAEWLIVLNLGWVPSGVHTPQHGFESGVENAIREARE